MLPQVDIIAAPNLSGDLRAALKDLERRAFPPQENNPYVWDKPQWHVIVRVEGEPVSYLGLFSRDCTVGGQPVKLGGVGSVMTAPEHRRQGHSTAALERAAAFLRDAVRADFGLLVTGLNLIPFYGRLGWQAVTDPLIFTQPDGSSHTWHDVTMILPLGKQQWPGGAIDLYGLPW